MKKLLKFIALIIPVFLYSQKSIQNAVDSSAMIVSGEVVQQYSYWTESRSTIYTVNTVEVSKIFKSNHSPSYVNVITEGGLVGMDGLIVSHQVRLRKKTKGYFFLQMIDVNLLGYKSEENLYKFENNANGFFSYDAYKDEVKLPKDKLKRDDFETILSSRSNQKTTLIKSQLLSSHISSLSSSAVIDQLNPTTIEAGDSQILTINGSGFGTPSGNTFGDVEFKNADDGGDTWLEVLNSQIVSWSDNQIKVEVPDFAGSGNVRVITLDNATVESSQSIVVPYAISNVTYQNRAYPIHHPGSMSNNGSQVDNVQNGAYIFQYNDEFLQNEDAVTHFEDALEDWVCGAGINFEISSETTTIDDQSRDYVNTISFADIESLGVTYQFFSGCDSNDGTINWIWSDIDILFSSGTNFGYGSVNGNQIDFEEVSRHEIGHAVGFGHNINSSTLMHYSVSSGNKTFTIDPYFTGSQIILSRDISAQVCGLELHTLSECSSIDPNLDSDGDGVKDIRDDCPDTLENVDVDDNGCALYQLDSDFDGVTDDIDQCATTPIGALVDEFGCADTDADGIFDYIDLCPNTPSGFAIDTDGCADFQKDSDGDGVNDAEDQCEGTNTDDIVDVTGCSVFFLDQENFTIEVVSESCSNSNDGRIEVSIENTGFDYTAIVNDTSHQFNQNTGFSKTIGNLSSGSYDICFGVDGVQEFEQCFGFIVTEPNSIDAYTVIDSDLGYVDLNLSGASDYTVVINSQIYSIQGDFARLPVDVGLNTIMIYTENSCQGIIEKDVFVSESASIFPNPASSQFSVLIGGNDNLVHISIVDLHGKTVQSNQYRLGGLQRQIDLSIDALNDGIYFVEIQSKSIQKNIKLVKYNQ